MEKIIHKNIEYYEPSLDRPPLTTAVASLALDLCSFTMRFARIERVPRYEDSRRESDVEHSYMLALLAPELAKALNLPLDSGLLSQYAIVHDLIELKTGDVATFSISPADLATKEAAEHDALEELVNELPPFTGWLVRKYESQSDPESRFVRAVDKLLPLVVDILGDGQRVIREDFNINDLPSLEQSHQLLTARIEERFGAEFPDIALAHAMLSELLEVEMESLLQPQ